MDLTEAEDIKKRWQEYTQKNYTKNIFMTQITMMVFWVIKIYFVQFYVFLLPLLNIICFC